MAERGRDAYHPPALESALAMKVIRHSLFAWIALLGIVFSQLAVAAYACPLLSPANNLEQVDAPTSMAGMPCAERDMQEDVDQAAMCAEHCAQDEHNVGATQPPGFHPALFLVHTVTPPGHEEAAHGSFVHAALLACSTSPPPLWRTGRLRI